MNLQGTVIAPITEGCAGSRHYMDTVERKPKLLFFQNKYENDLAPFLLVHKREHVQCLSLFFDVTVISEDCDFQEACDIYEPALAMFESGVPFDSCRRPVIRNVRSCEDIPKLGFLHADGFGEGRSGFLSDMDHCGIETFFAIATTAAEFTPAIADQLYVWPNFVNSDVYRDYGDPKVTDVLFTGNQSNLYPWRQSMVRIVPGHFHSVVCPHPGYTPENTRKITMGEPYARLLNSSWMVPACGTVAKDVVRKHFEVPACRSCLVAEESSALEAAGFVDMKNCLFVDESNAVDKIRHLLADRDKLQAIIDSGYSLVHTRHTMAHRDQVLQWFRLTKSLGPHQRITQRNPFEPLQVVDSRNKCLADRMPPNSRLALLLREANGLLWQGSYHQAETRYEECIKYYPFMPEPLLGMALCSLFQGRADAAVKWIGQPLEATLAAYRAIDPDPVEWAYYIVALLCQGKLREARKRSNEFGWLHHPELDRARWVIETLGCSESGPHDHLLEERPSSRLTLHQIPARSTEGWLDGLVSMLYACRQTKLATEATAMRSSRAAGSDARNLQAANSTAPVVKQTKEMIPHSPWQRRSPFIFLRADASGSFNRRRLYKYCVLRSRQTVKSLLRRINVALRFVLQRPATTRLTDINSTPMV